MDAYCRRCGQNWIRCVHSTLMRQNMTPEQAKQVQARYLIGREFDPEHHDTNDYFTPTTTHPAEKSK